MKSPKGFRKNYFTFASILAHSIQSKMQNLLIKAEQNLENNPSRKCSEFDENDPPLEELTLCLQNNFNKPCHCDYFFKLKTQLSITLFKFIPRCLYYCKFFAFRRTGIHPPIKLFY